MQTYNIFGPKKNDSWGSERNLIGPVGPVGATGANGASGYNGLSKAYYRLLDSQMELNSSNSKVVGRISGVSAGKYLVFFNTDVSNLGKGQYFGCGFEPQGDGGQGRIWIPEDALNGGVIFESRWNYSKNGYITVIANNGIIEVHCKINDNPDDLFVLTNGSLIAIAMNSVTSSVRVFPEP